MIKRRWNMKRLLCLFGLHPISARALRPIDGIHYECFICRAELPKEIPRYKKIRCFFGFHPIERITLISGTCMLCGKKAY